MARVRTISRACGRTIRSTYRCRTRVSSDSGLCATGSGRSALAVIAHESASTDSSPRRLVITSPVTPTWSPRSTRRFQSVSASAPTRSRDSIACSSVPSPSRRVAKQSLPVLRRKITRPVTATRSPVAVSVGRSAYRSRTSASVRCAGQSTGYGCDAVGQHPVPLVPADPHLLGQVLGGVDGLARSARSRHGSRADGSRRSARAAVTGRSRSARQTLRSYTIRRPISVIIGSWWVIVRHSSMHHRGQAAGGDHRLHRAELLDHPLDDPVDLAGEAEVHAGLQALDGVLADHRARLGRLDLAQLGGPGGERVEGDLDARARTRRRGTRPCALITSKFVVVPKSTTIDGPP